VRFPSNVDWRMRATSFPILNYPLPEAKLIATAVRPRKFRLQSLAQPEKFWDKPPAIALRRCDSQRITFRNSIRSGSAAPAGSLFSLTDPATGNSSI